jgi:transcriptional regulator with XRE-family HTH domain
MINSARLQQARELRRWTQTVIAQQVGVHQSAIAQLEAGRMQPSPEVLDAISWATGFPRAFFTRPNGPAFPLGSLRFRARATMTARQRRQAWWYAHTLAELMASMAAQTEYHVPRLPRLAGDPVAAAIVGDENETCKIPHSTEYSDGEVSSLPASLPRCACAG